MVACRFVVAVLRAYQEEKSKVRGEIAETSRAALVEGSTYKILPRFIPLFSLREPHHYFGILMGKEHAHEKMPVTPQRLPPGIIAG